MSAMFCCGNISVSRNFVSATKTITEGTFKLATVQECYLNWANPQEVKDNSHILSKKPTLKAQNIATFLLTNLGSCPESAQKYYFRTDTTPRGVAFY